MEGDQISKGRKQLDEEAFLMQRFTRRPKKISDNMVVKWKAHMIRYKNENMTSTIEEVIRSAANEKRKALSRAEVLLEGRLVN